MQCLSAIHRGVVDCKASRKRTLTHAPGYTIITMAEQPHCRPTPDKSTMTDIDTLRQELEGKSPRAILKAALAHYDNIAISFSGAEDVALIEMAHKLTDNLKVFTLDTGRLHPETYEFVDRVREHYNLDIEVMFPDSAEVEDLVRRKGLFSFYQDGHKECCGIRKINPMRRKLATLDAWVKHLDKVYFHLNDFMTVLYDIRIWYMRIH